MHPQQAKMGTWCKGPELEPKQSTHFWHKCFAGFRLQIDLEHKPNISIPTDYSDCNLGDSMWQAACSKMTLHHVWLGGCGQSNWKKTSSKCKFCPKKGWSKIIETITYMLSVMPLEAQALLQNSNCLDLLGWSGDPWQSWHFISTCSVG